MAPLAHDKKFLLACLLCGLPALLALYPPGTDMPQHAALIASIKAMLLGEPWPYAAMFEIKPFTPYWLGYGLVMLLSLPVGIVWAMKLVLALATSALVWAAARFCGRMGVPTQWHWMLLVTPFGFAWYWGFLNFIVAAPLGFLFLCALLDLQGRSDWRACWQMALWLHLLFFAHVLTAAFFCLLALALTTAPWQGMKAWLKRSLPVFTILPAALLWYWRNLQGGGPAAEPPVWWLGTHRLGELVASLGSFSYDAIGLASGLLFMAAPILCGLRFKRSLWNVLPFAAWAVWMLLVPHNISGTAFIYQRFGVFGLPLYLLCFDYRRDAERRPATLLRALVVAVALLTIGRQSWHSIVFNRDMAGYQQVIQHAEPGKRMLMLQLDLSGDNWTLAPPLAYPASWYQAEQAGLAEFNFAWFWQPPLAYRDNAATSITSDFTWWPDRFDWAQHHAERYDYFLVYSSAGLNTWLEQRAAGKATLLAHSGPWQLYGKADSAP